MEDRCVSCGNIIPEGRQICPVCDKVSREVLSIDEIIGHCKRQVQRFDGRYGYGYFETASLESTATKEYWEHKQVAQYLEELKRYREAESKQVSGDKRLIDAESVKLMLSELLEVAQKEKFTAEDTISHATSWIDNIPTAHDMEKVVEQLMVVHDEGWCPGDDLECVLDKACRDCYREKITEIVRKGGAE